MPSDYAPRNNKMHSREVRYERNDRFLGKRDWQRVAVFDRAPAALSSSNGGSYDPPNKRRPSGRHGFSENGRYREHNSRISDHPGMFGGGYSGFTHKNDRYAVPGMNHFPSSSAGRNGLRDGEEDYFRERDLLPCPGQAHPLPYNNSVLDPEVQRGPRYGPWSPREQHQHQHQQSWSPRDQHLHQHPHSWSPRDQHPHPHSHRERVSNSPDVLDRRYGVSRYGYNSAVRQDKEIEARLDRYGASREGIFGEYSSRSSREPHDEDLFRHHQQQRESLPVHEERHPSPRKKPRLTWGEGLAFYEKKNSSRSHVEPATQAAASNCINDSTVETGVSDSNRNVSGDAEGKTVGSGDADGYLASDKELTPIRERTPTVDSVTEVLTVDVPPLSDAADPVKTPVSSPIAAEEPKEEAVNVQENLDKPEDTSDTLEKVSKEVVLLQVEQVEMEIESIEKELTRNFGEEEQGVQVQAMETDKVERDATAGEAVPDGVSEEAREEVGVPEETRITVLEVVAQETVPEEAGAVAPNSDNVMTDAQDSISPQTVHQQVVEKCPEEFAHLFPAGYIHGRRLYSNPQEVEVWSRNEELHRLNRDRIFKQLANEKQLFKFKEQALVLKYRLLKYKPKGTGVRNVFSQRKMRHLDGEEDLKRLLMDPPTKYRETLKMPSMILSKWDTTIQQIITSNRLVEDPIRFEQERKSINPWTDEEKKIFLEKFAVHIKCFSKIASFLPHKTTGDCVEFYYRNQKSEELEKLRKKQQLKKRHSRASYLVATTTVTNGRLRGESNAVSLHKLHNPSNSFMCSGRPSRTNLRIVDRERPIMTSDCVTARDRSGCVVTGLCSLSSDAPLTPSRGPSREDHCSKQKGVRSSRSRREQNAEDADPEWTDSERELFVDALLLFGKDFKSISQHIRSRNESQCKTFFSKARKRLKLDRLLEQHNAQQVTTEIVQHAVVNRACEDPAEPKAVRRSSETLKAGQLITDRSFETVEMEVSVVVDGDTTEGTSAAPAALVDSPVSSVITSPGLVSSSSPAVVTAVPELKMQIEIGEDLREVGKDWMLSPSTTACKQSLTEVQGKDWSLLAPTISSESVTETSECVQDEDVGKTQIAGDEQPKLQVVDPAPEKNGLHQGPSTVLTVMHPDVQPEGKHPVHIPPVVLNEQQHMRILQQHPLALQQPPLTVRSFHPQYVKQENHHFTANTKLQQQDQSHQLLSLLTPQQQQHALQTHAHQSLQSASFIQQQGTLTSTEHSGNFVQSTLTTEASLRLKSSDVKLFGQSLLSQPPKPATDPANAAPFVLGESWCSGSAEAQDRARCRGLGNGIYHQQNGGYTISGTLPNGNTCTREALNMWNPPIGYCQQAHQQGTLSQAINHQQGALNPALNGFKMANGWHPPQQRIVAQLDQQHQQQHKAS